MSEFCMALGKVKFGAALGKGWRKRETFRDGSNIILLTQLVSICDPWVFFFNAWAHYCIGIAFPSLPISKSLLLHLQKFCRFFVVVFFVFVFLPGHVFPKVKSTLRVSSFLLEY